MNRKLRVIILTMVLTVLMFGGTRLMAQDNLDVNTTEASQTETPKDEGKVEPKAKEGEEVTSSVEEGKNTEIDGNEANGDEVNKTETETPEADKTEKTEGKPEAKQEEKKPDANPAEKPAAKEAEKPADDSKAEKPMEPADKTAEGNGPEDGAKAPAKVPEAQGAPAKGEEAKTGEGTDKGPKQIDKSTDEELNALQEQIDAANDAKDAKKAAELQKQYNEKYFKKVEEAGADKLDKEVLKRFTDKGKTEEFYEIQKEYEALKKKAEEGKLSEKDIDALNKLLGGFKPPRKLDADEEAAQKKLADSVDVKKLQDGAKQDAKDKLAAYKEAKAALQAALDADKTEGRAANLADLVKAFEDAEKALKEGIDNGTIKPSYTDGDPTVRVFPLVNGSLGDELKETAGEDNTYYIPDNTDINLLLHINKDKEPQKFTFTIKAADKGAEIKGEKASNLAFLNGEPVELKYDEKTDSYSFTVNSDKTFGIAQLRFNVPGFEGPFHKGFDLEMDLNDTKVTKKFRITKKGYEDEANLNGPGSDEADDPTKIPEVDAGETEDAKVKEDSAEEVLDFFTYLKKSNTYIDDVTFNSGNGESLPLDSVDITITVPEHNEKFAEMIHKSGLKYDLIDEANGVYRLKLDTKVFGGNLEKDDKGDFYYVDGTTKTKLNPANLTNVILENAGKKVYVDENGTHEIITSEVLEGGDYQLRFGGDKNSEKTLWKKVDDNYSKLGKFNADGLLVDEQGNAVKVDKKFVKLDGKNLITYTNEYDVYDGNVANKKDNKNNYKADTDVTPTYEGKQVTIEKDGETSYGGTIVEGAIYDKDGKIFKETGYTVKPGKVLIGADGKEVTGITYDEKNAKVDEKTGVKIVKVGDKIYHIVENPVFKNGYIIDGLEYKEGLSLIDKFGKRMDVEVEAVDDGSGNTTYTFKRKVKDKEGNETNDEVKSGDNTEKTRKVVVDEDVNKQILVDSKNEVVDNTEDAQGKKTYEIVGPKYYYDGEKFVEAKGDGLKGNKFFEGYQKLTTLIKKTIETYKVKNGDTEETITLDRKNKKVYQGSTKPEDYFKIGENGQDIYVKKTENGNDIYVTADPNKVDEILSVNKLAKIVQTLKINNKDIEKVTEETDIFNAIQNAKFALKFPGFLAGKNVVYNVHADVKATYLAPNPKKEGEFIKKSIFKDDSTEIEADKTKKIDKFFTLKNEKSSSHDFFKNAPEELSKTPDYHFFNIFYRGLNDRDRDKLIIELLKTKKTEDGKNNNNSGEEKKELNEKEKKEAEETKAKLALLDKLQSELSRLYDSAKFDVATDDKGNEILVIKDKEGNIIKDDELNKMRSLLWEIGFNNSKGNLFPENKDTEIVIEDHSMDNRLVYDEIIVNDTKEKWNEAKTNWENNTNNAGKKFQGTDEYFFLDQIKNIKFGVNPNFVEGRFVPLGENFNLTGEEIIAKLNENPNAESVEIEKGDEGKKIKFLITRDKNKGQVRIKVLNAYYKHNDSYNKESNDNNYKFSSPVQEAYQKKMKEAQDKLKAFGEDDISDVNKITEFETAFENLLQVIHKVDSDCYKTIKGKFNEIMTEIKNITGTNADAEKLKKLNQVKKTLQDEIPNLNLKYLDSNKGDYKNDDMRFNAIHITINSGVSIGGALAPQKTKKLGITSVIVPEIDIPYTDEFGKPLTNKDMYVKAEIEKIKKDKKFNKVEDNTFKPETWKKSEDTFRKVMEEAYRRVNEKIDLTSQDKLEIKDLVKVEDPNKDKFAWEKYTVTKGKDLKFEDLAPNDKDIIKDKAGNSINPWYIGKDTVEERFKAMFGQDKYSDKPEYKKLEEKAIDIAAYYMSSQGYDRATYANKAVYKLAGSEEKPGIFGSESDWHKKVCYSGILGKCIEDAGKGIVPDTEPSGKNFGTDGKDDGKFELTYEPSHDEPDKENPKTDKSTEDKEVDISEENKEKSVDFTIEVTVDKMTKEQKDIADALTPDDDKKMTEEEKAKAEAEAEEAKKHYNEKTGYYEYKNSLIIDFLPNIFKLKDDTKLTFEAKKKELMANGANKIFADEKEFENWKKGIEYFYTDDLEAEYEKLSKSSNKVDKEKAEVLKKAIDDAKASGKIKDGQKVQAVLAWVPTFEAPHGSKNQFTFKLSNVYVNKKKFKDFNDGVIGTNYTNHAAFGDKAKFYFGSTTVNIHKDKHGYVNKYLQVLDKDNNVIDKDKADGWFKGNVELKFGDKFNYRIEYKNNNNIVPVPGEAHSKAKINIKDIFKDGYKGFRPVLNGFVESDFEFKNQVTVTYKIGDTPYTEDAFRKAIEDGKVKFSDVTSLELEGFYENGATHNFILPMMIPNIDAKVENGNVYYIGQDGKRVELGEAKDFFDLGKLTDKDSEMAFDNTVDGSNTVTVYLEKERFIRVFKEFLDRNGEKLKDLNNLEAKFDIYQIIEENGVKKRVKVGELKANKDNNFTDMLDHLPIFKKTTTIKEDGTVKVEEINYEYELVEKAMPGFESKVYKLDDSDKLGFVWQATNTEKHEEPEYPGDNPKKEHKEVTVTINVNKTWEVLNNGSTPSIEVELYANGKATGKIFTLGDGNWSATFKDLPAKDKDGNDIIYTVVEVGSANGITMIEDRKFEVIYKTNADGSITILNKEVPNEEPKDKEEPKKDEPQDDEGNRDSDQGKKDLPKTGVAEDLASIYFAFVLLLGLVFIKKRYLVK